MTREEAIREWTFRSNYIKKWLDEYGEEPSIRHYVELIDMAIEALSAPQTDYISRTDAIEAVRLETAILGRGLLNKSDIISILEALPSAEAEWIPCSDRLPKEEKKTYWVCTNTEYQCECRWTNNRFGMGEGEWGWSIFDTPQYSKPIAWMPLPTPYKGGAE